MNEPNRLIQACDDNAHDWIDTPDGFTTCRKCGMKVDDNFWGEDPYDEEPHSYNCVCELCIQNYPERWYLLKDDLDWEDPYEFPRS